MRKLYGKSKSEIDDMNGEELDLFLLRHGGVNARALIRDVIKWAAGNPGCYRLPGGEED